MFIKILLFLSLSFSFAEMIPTDVLLDLETVEISNSPFFSTGGSIDSFGGGDSVDVRRLTAWFYGDKPVQTCFLKIDDFSVDAEIIFENLNKAKDTWSNYFFDNKINQAQTEKINHNFNIKENCSGDEDLVLYFGTGPIHDNLSDLKARQSLSNPIAFTNKTHISDDLKWSKGYIRFVGDNEYRLSEDKLFPNWNSGDTLYSMILHELGHVLGFIHKENTIMTGKIVTDLFVHDLSHSTIDQNEELHPCVDCIKEYKIVFTKNESVFPLNGILFLDQTAEEIKFLNDTIQTNYVISKDLEPILLSMFQSSSNLLSLPQVYFFSYSDLHFSLEFKFQRATVRRNGELFAELIFNRSL